jgi:sporulation protein YlmC with PRC-barrel domain
MLMVRAFVCINENCALSTEVRRGMQILSIERNEIGKVAAVMLDPESRNATHLLLSRLPEIRGYWIIPLDMVLQIKDKAVLTNITEDNLDGLTLWHHWE